MKLIKLFEIKLYPFEMKDTLISVCNNMPHGGGGDAGDVRVPWVINKDCLKRGLLVTNFTKKGKL